MPLTGLACPRCGAERFQEAAAGVVCESCRLSFPAMRGIIDFRDAELDTTAAFSIADDRALAAQLSNIFESTTTFNELHDVYRILTEKRRVGLTLTGDEVRKLLTEGSVLPRRLSSEQLGHGKAILEKIPQYISETTLGMPPNDVALENGCGLGLFIDGFARHFKRLVVLDFSLCYLLLAKKIAEERKLDNVTLVCASVERLPLKSATFDFVHSNNVIEHISNQPALFSEAKRVLKSNGLFFVLSPNRFSSYYEPHFRLPFFGFIPKTIRRKIIQIRQNRSIDDISLLSLSEVKALAAGHFGKSVFISFIPRRLAKTATGGLIREFLVASLNSRVLGPAANLLLNKALLGVMPYHVVLCRKDRV